MVETFTLKLMWPGFQGATAKRTSKSDFDVKSRLAPPKSTEIDEKHLSDTKKCRPKNFLGIEKSKIANRLKRVFPKFEANRSHVRGVNGRSKFDVVQDVRSCTTLYDVVRRCTTLYDFVRRRTTLYDVVRRLTTSYDAVPTSYEDVRRRTTSYNVGK